MKYLIFVLGLIVSLNIQAQERKTDKKNVETTFQVKGVCSKCKDRIENAALRTKGVKHAEWNKESHKLKLVYNSKKTTEELIHQEIAAHGHTTSQVKADSAVYKKLPKCCLYEDGAKCSN